ncbi:MAG: hypothetical protein KGL35_24710 [Bradyrhizobium sp.]|nr:hypothetical protein [Bradyrhizobium sp.]
MTAALALDTRPVTLARVAVDRPHVVTPAPYPVIGYTVRFETGETVTLYDICGRYVPRVGWNFSDLERAAIAAIDLARLCRLGDTRYSATHLLAVNGARRELEALGFRLEMGEMA